MLLSWQIIEKCLIFNHYKINIFTNELMVEIEISVFLNFHKNARCFKIIKFSNWEYLPHNNKS